MRRRGYAFAIAFTLLLIISSVTSVAAIASGKSDEISIPAPRFKAEYAKGLIEYPRLSVPAFVIPGSELTIYLAKSLNVKAILLDDGYGHAYWFNGSWSGKSSLTVRLPKDIIPAIYDLIIVLEDGKAYGEPKAVVVGLPENYKELYIVHITDRHFGVINGNGRAASNYDLAAAMYSLALPENTIVIDTGDIADTAAAPEYKESLWVDYLLNKPIITIPGNHDHVAGSRLYGVYRGLYNYTLSVYGIYRIVAIDSGSEGYIDSSQATWAANILTHTTEPIAIVLFHHPHFTHLYSSEPIVFNVTSAEQLFNLLLSKKPGSKYPYIYTSWLANKDALKTLVKGIYECPSRLVLVLSGHIHMDSYAKVVRSDGSIIQYVVTTATGGSVRVKANDYHGFRIIQLSADGTYRILGDGMPWSRHASFSLENTTIAIVESETAASVIFVPGNPTLAKLLNKTVVALPIPEEYYGKRMKLFMKGLENITIRCTPLSCIAYGYSEKPPEPGKTYILAFYTKEDMAPPTIKVERITPKSPAIGSPVSIEFRVYDDSWGVAEVYAKLQYDGKTQILMPAKFGSKYRLVIPGLNTTKLAVTLVALDASGKVASKSIEITYTKPTITATAEETSTPTTTTSPTGTPAKTTTTSPPAPTLTTTPERTTPTPTTPVTTQATTPGVGGEGGEKTPLIIVSVALIIGAALAVIALRRVLA